jgi:hypothetical protein
VTFDHATEQAPTLAVGALPPASYTPLYGPDDSEPFPLNVAAELRLSRAYLEQAAAANIHDGDAMIRAAVGLHYRLSTLVAALDAERGEQP